MADELRTRLKDFVHDQLRQNHVAFCAGQNVHRSADAIEFGRFLFLFFCRRHRRRHRRRDQRRRDQWRRRDRWRRRDQRQRRRRQHQRQRQHRRRLALLTHLSLGLRRYARGRVSLVPPSLFLLWCRCSLCSVSKLCVVIGLIRGDVHVRRRQLHLLLQYLLLLLPQHRSLRRRRSSCLGRHAASFVFFSMLW